MTSKAAAKKLPHTVKVGNLNFATEEEAQEYLRDQQKKPSKWGLYDYWWRFVACGSLMFIFGFFHVMVTLTIAAWFSKIALAILIMVVSTVIWPAQTWWPGFVNSWLLLTWRKYFRFSFKYEKMLDREKHYMFAHFPHGVYPIGQMLAPSIVEHAFPGMKVFGISASNVFRTPLFRHIMSWLGAQPATRENFKSLLKIGSCGVVVGGLAEMYMQHQDREELMLRSRKGFVEVAVQSGVEIVPIYYFGNSKIVDFGPRFLSGISRKLKMSFGLIYGLWGLPIPRPHPICMVIGEPIPVQQKSDKDPEFKSYVDSVHAQVIESLQRLYERHRAEFGWADKPLVIV